MADTTKPTQYRRGVEIQPGYQSYEERYEGINLDEEKRSLFPLQSTGIWTELNPKVPRVDYLGLHFVNKDTGWTCGDLGAIIKTTNGGGEWTISETNTTTLLLKVHSFNEQIVIVTGYNGTILRSTDGGVTFNQVTSGVTTDLWSVKLLNDTVGFICGLNQTLFKTTDAGQSWQFVNTGINQHYWAIDFLNEQFGMIACGGGIVLKTTNGGNSWTQIQAGDASALYTIDIIDTLHIAGAGANGKNVYSSNGGTSWIQNNRLQHDELNSIRFIDTETGYTIGTYGGDSWGIRKTTNKGVTWFSPPTPNLSEWELELLPGGMGFSVGSMLNIYKTTGGYDNWEGLFLNADFVDVYFTDELTGYAADGRNIGGPLYKTTDGGLSWFSLPNFPTSVFTFTLNCVVFTDSLTGFVGGAPARIVKTTDAGISWYIVNRTGLTDTIGLINRIYFINNTTGWAVTTRGGILKTTDAGENWFAQFNAGINYVFRSINFIDSLIGWVLSPGFGGIYQSIDGGINWVRRTDIQIYDGSDIYFIDSIGFVINFLELDKTTDSGNNWVTQINTQYVIRSFGWLSSNHGFIVGDGVYETNDSGNTWQEILELRNIGLRKLHSPINDLGYSVGNIGLIYKYIDTTIIPIELIYFDAKLNGNYIELKWSTATELNNKGFEIERSNDKINWEMKWFMDGKGTSTEINDYFFKDNLFENNSQKLFYRLKQIDFNGSFEYSNIIEVEVGTPLGFYLSQNYPNPFNPTTKIKFDLPKDGLVSLEIYDILGRRIATVINENKTAGSYEQVFNASSLASGVYIYKLQTGDYFSSKKLVLLK